jgi:hypothetical protein
MPLFLRHSSPFPGRLTVAVPRVSPPIGGTQGRTVSLTERQDHRSPENRGTVNGADHASA